MNFKTVSKMQPEYGASPEALVGEARLKRFRLLLIHVAGRMNRNNCVMGLRLCNNNAALKRVQKIWQVSALPTQATAAQPLGRRGG